MSVAQMSIRRAMQQTFSKKKIQAIVKATEERLGKTYRESQRAKQVEAAQQLLSQHPDLTLASYLRSYDARNDAWWQEKNGLLHVTHMAAPVKGWTDRYEQALSWADDRAVKAAAHAAKEQATAEHAASKKEEVSALYQRYPRLVLTEEQRATPLRVVRNIPSFEELARRARASHS